LSFPADEDERQELRELLRTLGEDDAANAKRIAMCKAVATGLARLGQVLWVQGSLLGPHRVSGESRHGFGDDRVVGIATVAQIGGELARASIELLRAGNRYAASALVRQLFEVEYLAHAFAGDHESAAAWLRADQKERREFWAPQRLRSRADGAFIDEHFWSHCERGGHPTTEGMALLPDHGSQIDTSFLWVDLAGHLANIWRHTFAAAEAAHGQPIPTDEWKLQDVDAALEAWRSSDLLYAAFQDLGAAIRETP
jgi:hypothetical protein